MPKARFIISFKVSEVHTINISFISHVTPKKTEVRKGVADVSSKYHFS